MHKIKTERRINTMSRHAYNATMIVRQLYHEQKANRVIALINDAKDDHAVDRILRDARHDRIK